MRKLSSSLPNDELGDGIKCGKGWISRDKKCSKNAGESASNSLDLFSAAVEAVTHAKRVVSDIDELNKYFADGKIDSQNEGIFKTIAGAMGIQAYFSSEYPEINKFFYDKEYREKEVTEDIKMKAEAAVIGFDELPTHSFEEIKNHYAEKGVDYDGKTLYRGLSFSSQEDLDSFVRMHEGNPDSNGITTVTYEAFTSTSLADPNSSKDKKVDGGWGRKALQIEIEHKGENSTGAKWVDQRKRTKDEGEMLFKPGAKFEVVRIEKEWRERLPDRLREPLQSVWKSTDEGGNVSNLPASALLGEKSPQAILEDPSFEYFRKFLKKRGLPPIDEWPNLPLSKIFKVNDMRGGRFAIMNELVKALSDQIKEEERTNQKELSGAKIFLKEI